MKQVLKGTEPASLTDWKASANDDWQPTYAVLQNPEKRTLHLHLLEEQGFFCCYCGRNIGIEDSHIEHFRPQEHYQNLALDYRNLFASCIRETKPGLPLHCGHKKGNWFDEDKCISPTDEGCERRFRYLSTGLIQSSEKIDAAASTMIEVLELDTPYLVNRREQSIRSFFDTRFLMEATEDELLKIVSILRSKALADQNAFDHVLARFAEQLANA